MKFVFFYLEQIPRSLPVWFHVIVKKTASGIFRFHKVLYFGLILSGIFLAIHRRWIADDAFISFRYASSLKEYGALVYNKEERVEGFTNFLWTLMLAPFSGMDLIVISQIAGIICFVLLLIIFYHYTKEFFYDKNQNAFFDPSPRNIFVKRQYSIIESPQQGAAAGASIPLFLISVTLPSLALHEHMTYFATSGLETMMFTLFVTASSLSFFSIVQNPHAPKFRLITSFFLVASCFTRPDGLLPYAITGVFLAVYDFRIVRNSARFSVKRDFVKKIFLFSKYSFINHCFFLVVFVPYWVFRWKYYGSFFPNTFYAKSGSESYIIQGLTYLAIYGATYWFLFLGSIFTIISIFRMQRNLSFEEKFFYFYILCIPLFWIFYIVRIGGDFMFARFLIPVTPLLFFFIEAGIWVYCKSPFLPVPDSSGNSNDRVKLLRLSGSPLHSSILFFTALILPFFYIFQVDVFSLLKKDSIRGIYEEHKIYRPQLQRQYIELAKSYAKVFREEKIRTAFYGAQAFLMYYMEVPFALESSTGLTDSYVASLTLRERGRIGHEKTAPYDYLLFRKIHLSLSPPPQPRQYGFNSIFIEGFPVPMEIICYERTLMQSLMLDRRFQFIDFEKYLDQYLKDQAPVYATIEEDYKKFYHYYFLHNNDLERMNLFLNIIHLKKKRAGFQ